MSTTLKILVDYRNTRVTRRSGPQSGMVELGPWLDVQANKEMLYNMRLFYVLKPNADDVVKFGIAGLDGKSGGWARLHQYINEYGFATELSPCTGIRLLYLAGTVYNPNVVTTDSAIFRKEKACKDYFRDTALKGRGFERILLERINELFKIIDDKSNKSWGDIEKDRRTSDRLAQADITPDDKVVSILNHDTISGKSRAKTKYLVKWSRPYVLQEQLKVKNTITKNVIEDDTTWETHNSVMTFLDGARMLEVYKTLHPTAKFRD